MELTKIEKRRQLIDKSLNVLLFTYTMLFILYHSIAGLYVQVWIDRLECVAGAVMAVVMLMKLAVIEKDERIKWFKSSFLVIIYFVIRTATFIDSGFDYSVARTVFFEGIYMFVICGMIIDSRFCKEKIMKLYVVVNFALNVVNVAFYFIFLKMGTLSGFGKTLADITFVSRNGVMYSSMYDNPNAFGIMTALAIIIAFNLISKNDTKARKLVIVVYMLFSLYCVNLSECRSAMLSLFACAVAWAIVVISKKKITGRMLVICAFAVALLATGGIYGFMHVNESEGLYSYTETETSLQDISSSRYYIWKSGYYAHQDNRMLGTGSLNLEMNDRNSYIYQYYVDNGYDVETFAKTDLGPHNGYLAMIYCTGMLGFILFMAALLQKILEAKSMKCGGWYLAVIFFMSVNMFETMTIVSRFFVCLMTFIILAMDNNDEEHGYDMCSSNEAKLL